MNQKAINLTDVISKDELRLLRSTSNWRASYSLLFTWAIIISCFAMVILLPNPITFIFATLILAGRQLSLAILTHDCVHACHFSSHKLNNFIGTWLCAGPMNIPFYDYRTYHFEHHRYAGTDKDPDIKLVVDYPVAKDSLRRKFTRDITGRTGLRDTLYKIKNFKLKRDFRWPLFHILLLSILIAVGFPWAYSLWWVAELFIFPLIFRIRNIGEHGVALDRTNTDPRLNTHTTIANWWERLLLAPNHVNYHLEHHHFANIPSYKLPQLHKALVSGGYYNGFNCFTKGYANMLKRAVRVTESINKPTSI